ncbi:MAG TPA: ABC transporter substrate-binding protein [Stellaceae bacterium]|nr:ABC transporter substrate-binding protein [Stellaceae bacterium]
MKHSLARLVVIAGLVLSAAHPAVAQKKYAPGITDTEIKFGQTLPLSGPVSAYGQIGRAEEAYFQMINDQGGVNGRKLTLVQADDGYSPPKTVEQTRKLVEEQKVAFIFSSIGTPTNLSVEKYLNDRKVPQLWIGSGSHDFAQPKRFPWTIAFLPSYLIQGSIYAKYILANKPDAKIAVLRQNDDFGKDLYDGFVGGLGDKAKQMIVATATYEVSDPSVDQQVISLRGSGADTLFVAATPKFSAQAIRKVYDIGWKPLYFVNFEGSAVSAVLKPAGLDKSVGLISTAYLKDPTDPQWKDDPGFKDWLAWMNKYMPGGDVADLFNITGYTEGMMLVHILKACGDDLSRENIMHQVMNLKHVTLPTFQPGVEIDTAPDDYVPLKQMRLVRFDGKTWVPFGSAITGQLSSLR